MEAALSFLEHNQDVLGIADPRASLRLTGENVDKVGIRHVFFDQLYHGIEVVSGQLTAHFSRDGRLELVNGSYFPDIALPSVPVVPKEEAKSIVRKAVGSADSLDLSRCRLIVYPWEGKCYLAWQIVAVPGGEYFVDGLTGSVIFHWNGVPDVPEGSLRRIQEIPPPAPTLWKPSPESNKVRRPAPAGEPRDSLRGGTESEPGSHPGEARPVGGAGGPQSQPKGQGWLVTPPEQRPKPADTIPKEPPPRQQSAAVRGANSLVTIMTQGFEGDFPDTAAGWVVKDYPTWDDVDCMPYSGGWSAWCAGWGGPDPCGPNDYPNSMCCARMVFGPFSLADAKAADLSFWYWLRSEPIYDAFWWAASHDGANFYGYLDYGISPGWVHETFPLCDYLGDNSVWIEFYFNSDSYLTDRGAFVDDIALEKRTDGQADLTCYQPPGWDGAIVASNQRGTHTSDPIPAGSTCFIDVAWQNTGVACAGDHRVRLLLNSTTIFDSSMINVPPGYWREFDDIPVVMTSPGLFALQFVVDIDGSVAESNENNNTCSDTVTVECAQGRAVGAGCSVVQGVSHSTVNTNCDGTLFDLIDYARNEASPIVIKTSRFIYSYQTQVYTDEDNVWNDPARGQCQGVDAHVYTGLTYDYMLNILDRDGYDGKGSMMKIAVDNPDTNLFDNSGWDSLSLLVAIGIPAVGRLSLAGCPDGVAHEWGHALTFRASDLIYQKEPGALNESFSDMLGVSVGFFYDLADPADPDFLINENSYTNDSATRDMQYPLQHGQPDTYHGINWFPLESCTPVGGSGGNDFCGVHINSGVPNKMFYLLAEGGAQNGISVQGIGVNLIIPRFR